MPALALMYGHRMYSPEPTPMPARITLGPSTLRSGKGSGMSWYSIGGRWSLRTSGAYCGSPRSSVGRPNLPVVVAGIGRTSGSCQRPSPPPRRPCGPRPCVADVCICARSCGAIKLRKGVRRVRRRTTGQVRLTSPRPCGTACRRRTRSCASRTPRSASTISSQRSALQPSGAISPAMALSGRAVAVTSSALRPSASVSPVRLELHQPRERLRVGPAQQGVAELERAGRFGAGVRGLARDACSTSAGRP